MYNLLYQKNYTPIVKNYNVCACVCVCVCVCVRVCVCAHVQIPHHHLGKVPVPLPLPSRPQVRMSEMSERVNTWIMGLRFLF